MRHLQRAASLEEWHSLHDESRTNISKIALQEAFDPTPVDITDVFDAGNGNLRRALREMLPLIDTGDKKIVLPAGLVAAVRAKDIDPADKDISKVSVVSGRVVAPSEYDIQHTGTMERLGKFTTYASFGNTTTVIFAEGIGRGAKSYKLQPGDLLSIAPIKLQKNQKLAEEGYSFPKYGSDESDTADTPATLVEIDHKSFPADSPEGKVIAMICSKIPELAAYHPDNLRKQTKDKLVSLA